MADLQVKSSLAISIVHGLTTSQRVNSQQAFSFNSDAEQTFELPTLND